VIVLTSFGDDARIFPAIKAGAAGYLLKDVEPQELLGDCSRESLIVKSAASRLCWSHVRRAGLRCDLFGGPMSYFHQNATSLERLPSPAAAAWGETLGGQSGSCSRELDASGDLELVAPERYRAHRHPARKRLLGGADTAVGHATCRALEQRQRYCMFLRMGCVLATQRRGEVR
jgi:hypothetical protein